MQQRNPERLQRRDDFAREFSAMRERRGLTRQEVADSLGVCTASHVQSIEAPGGAKSLNIQDVPALPRELAVDVLQLMGSLIGYEISPAQADALCVGELSTLHTLQRESSDVLTALLEALADGELSETELERIERELEEDIEVKQRVLNDVRNRRAMKRQEKREIAELVKADRGALAASRKVV